jgi:hypothetical protein
VRQAIGETRNGDSTSQSGIWRKKKQEEATIRISRPQVMSVMLATNATVPAQDDGQGKGESSSFASDSARA